MTEPVDVIAIDGPAGSGKSTVAKSIARTLDWDYIDTGAMYRCICLKAIRNNIGFDEEEKLVEELEETTMRMTFEDGELRVYMDGQDVSRDIRQNQVSKHVSEVAQLPKVRENLVEKQRDMGRRGGVVMDGRDIGTVVFPNARYKFFLDASLEIRARRRYNELREKGQEVEFESVVEEIKDRDETDRKRSESPMKPADDAIHVDTSDKSVEDVVDTLLDAVEEKRHSEP
ncbi:MAG: (d)CMP kinase [bacterium]